jgi:hypothetical protein
MKKILVFIFGLAFMSACVKDIALTPVKEPSPVLIEPKQESIGTFINGVHAVSGMVKIISDKADTTKKFLSFENFKTEEGPDLYIYLAEDTNAKGFVSIMKLDKTGTFTLELPADIALNKQKYVLIWCKRFTVLFGSAKLN